jgi:hypothetical protein
MTSEARVCSVCGFPTQPESRFCPQCGHRLEGGAGDAAIATPPRLFGVLAPGPTFVLACVLLVGGILALIVGSPIAAIALLAFAAAAFVLFYGAAERDPGNPVARRAVTSGRRIRGWALFGRESLEAWGKAVRDLAKLSGEARSLRRERKRVVVALGEAAYREDDATIGALRVRLHEIDHGLVARRKARSATVANARRHVHDEHIAAQPTQRFSANELTSGGRSDS